MKRFGQHLRFPGTPPRLFVSALALGIAFLSQGGFISESHSLGQDQ
jgi:quinohemoprotein ethanol dehydrogenase